MKTPTEKTAKRCLAIREASKRGQYCSRSDQRFIVATWKKYPEWYGATEADVFNATVPFGSNVTQPTTQTK